MSNIAAPESGCKPSGILSPTMQAMHGELCALIAEAQVASPHEHVGQIWAKPVSLQAWCEIGGFALRTLKELIKYPPIRRYQCNLPGGKVTLLRVGDPGPEQDKVLAKQIAAYFLAATKEETVSRNEFGMLCGLAHDWPDGWQVEIFKHAIIHWPDFMDVVKVEVEIALEVLGRGDDPFHPEALADPLYATARRYCGRGDKLSLRVYRRPFIPLLRAFWPIAVELFIDHRESMGGPRPERIWGRWSDPALCTGVRHALSTS